MEEVQVIDCPPTPGSSEILLSNTPSASLLDMLDSSSSAEDDNCTGEADDGTTESGRSSPPPKCAICLGKCRQKCYTDSCRHQFCYRCLLEWSKIKAECPLCKQVFRSIIYDQKTEHIIFPPTTPPASGSAAPGPGRAPPQVYHRLDFTLSQPPRFTYSATLRVQPSQSERLQQLFLHQSGDVQRFSREFPDDTIPSRQNGPEWRRYIYHRRLHARPLADVNGRLRECSASFYRENPAQIHRLMPWINRELIALCRGNPSQVTLILEDFPNLLMSHDITSPAFRERVSYWGRARTIHFVHELLNFARSPYDMIGYDRCVQYDPYYNNNVVVLSSSSSSSSGSGLSGSDGEDDVVRIVEPLPGTSGMASTLGESSGSRRGRTQFTIETRSSDQTVIMTGSFGGAGVSGIVSVSTSGTQTGGPMAGASGSGSFADLTRMHPLTSLAPQTSRLEDGANISLSSDDSDDCRIIGALKPPHLRTPEMVSLESESDSDVVFVNEDNNRMAEDPRPVDSAVILEEFLNSATGPIDSGVNQNDIAKLETVASASEYNNGASTSSGSSGGMKKFYAKPKLNRFANGIGFKSIYEASESEKSKVASLHSESDSSSHDEVKFNIRGHATINSRKRKTTKRRSRASSSGSSGDCSDQSSTSDTASSNSSSSVSSLSSSMSSSSSDDSDNDFQSTKPPKKILKKRSKRSNVRSTRKSSSKRRSKELKRRSKAKKHLSSKRHRKRSNVAKSSSESGKGTSVSATSVPSVDAGPSGSNSNTSPKASLSCSKKRKLRSAIVKPSSSQAARHSTYKKRRKAPICSELISTDFSSDENPPEHTQMAPVQASQDQPALPSSASVSENNSSDSDDGQCTIASLIRAVQQTAAVAADPTKQGTSTSSSSSASATTPNTSSFSHADTSSSPSVCSSVAHHQLVGVREAESIPEEDVSVSQAIAVGAEVEL